MLRLTGIIIGALVGLFLTRSFLLEGVLMGGLLSMALSHGQ
jgi:hypothetical protein